MNETDDRRPVEQRLESVEARLIEQEHRLYSALRNFLSRDKWPKGDPRRRASWLALIWVWFGPMTLAVGGGGATLGVLIWQNWLIREQNKHFATQLGTLDKQIMATEKANRAAERTQLIGVLWDVKEVGFIWKKKVPLASPRTRKEALVRFVQIERARIKESGDAETLVDLSGAQLSDIVAPGLDLGNMSKISFERADFRGADLTQARLEGAILRSARLERAILRFAQLDGADLSSADLQRASLWGPHLEGANLSRIHVAQTFFYRPHLEGAIVAEQHPHWLDEDVWTTAPNGPDRLGFPQWKIRRR